MRAHRAALIGLLCCAFPSSVLRAQEPRVVDFRTEVLPLLEESCLECHREAFVTDSGRLRKPRGGLRVDGASFLLAGGNDGPAVVPGDSRSSPLFQRISLPGDDPDLMPEDGPRLADEAIATIKAWIDGGADFGGWIGAGEAVPDASEPAPMSESERVYAAIAERLPTVDPVALDRVRTEFGTDRIQLRFLDPDERMLRVQFSAHRKQIDDALVQALAPLRDHIVELDLTDSRVTDRAASSIASMRSLVRLQLDRTAVTGRTLRSLAELPELRVLHLVGCRGVTDADLGSLQGLTGIRRLYVWKSGLGAESIQRLRKARPELQVFGAPSLPRPEPADGETPPNRRRR